MNRLAVIFLLLSLLTVGALMLGACGTNVVVIQPTPTPPPPDIAHTTISAGGAHTCGLMEDNTVACWGRDFYGQSSPPSGIFQTVSVGGNHTCGLMEDNTVACWGLGSDPNLMRAALIMTSPLRRQASFKL